MIVVLIVAAIISGFLSDVTDTIVIIAIVIINAIIGFIQEDRAEKALEALQKMALTDALVMRNNYPTSVSSTMLVPGDIILLEAGNVVPADIRLMEAVQLKINESSLTGESMAVEKQTKTLTAKDLSLGDYTNMAFNGTYITNGHGKGIVVATGMQTEFGKIAGFLEKPATQTPLQKRLSVFGRTLAYIIFFICALIYCRLFTGRKYCIDVINFSFTCSCSHTRSVTCSNNNCARQWCKKNGWEKCPRKKITSR